ncbi:MAG: holin-associated N-acetylmuramidase [Paracoccaceae bacterium]
MQNIKNMAKAIVHREGGYVFHPNDPGGATKYGVTLATLRQLGLDINDDQIIDEQDVKDLSSEKAVDIYVEHYFNKPNISLLPDIVHENVFDMYVNSGRRAVRLFQQLLCDMGSLISVEGEIGPQTQKAGKRLAQAAPDHLNDAYAIVRRNYYLSLGDERPRLRKFARTNRGEKGGWVIRAESFMSPKYHLSSLEFQMRVSKWV